MKRILDACCGGKMCWFDKNNPDVVFMDIRKERHTLCDGRTLYVSPDVVAERIRIKGIRFERLQNISDEDCIKEGIFEDEYDDNCFSSKYFYDYNNNTDNGFYTPREAFASLIDKVSGKGTWERNPYVVVYDYELVK